MPWQVEISAKWQNYFGKAEEMLNSSYPLFMTHRLQAQCAADVEALPERFCTFGINGRKMLVDFLLMTQLRVDNKKSYRIWPPQGAIFFPPQGDLHIRCFECGQQFVPMREAPEHMSDCRYCSKCWPKKTEGDNIDVDISAAQQTANRKLNALPSMVDCTAQRDCWKRGSATGGKLLSEEAQPFSLQQALCQSNPLLRPMKVLMEGTDQDDEAFEYSHPVAARYHADQYPSIRPGSGGAAKTVMTLQHSGARLLFAAKTVRGNSPTPISLSNELGALGY